MDLLDRLLDHDRWTTARVLDLSRGLSDAELDRRFDIGHATLRATYEHMIFSLEVWTSGMVGQRLMSESDDLSVATLFERHERIYPIFADIARRMQDEQRLDETFVDPWIDSPVTLRTFGTGTAHVLLHDMQHRSETLHILKRLGVTDLPDGDPKEWEEANQIVQG
ncbi:MAG TPA: DinB family protein [Thermomicrobiales bacterium]|nr:DinB family protein [Thermomicrobiales bacterium]